jgi:hypothetical protein
LSNRKPPGYLTQLPQSIFLWRRETSFLFHIKSCQPGTKLVPINNKTFEQDIGFVLDLLSSQLLIFAHMLDNLIFQKRKGKKGKEKSNSSAVQPMKFTNQPGYLRLFKNMKKASLCRQPLASVLQKLSRRAIGIIASNHLFTRFENEPNPTAQAHFGPIYSLPAYD